MKSRLISISNFRSALAFGLVLWCAGAGCLAHGMAMGGGGPKANSKAEKSQVQSDMAMNGHACCKAQHRALRHQPTAKLNSDDMAGLVTLPEESLPDGANSCCPLTSGSFVIASRNQTNDNDTSVLAATGSGEQSVETKLPAHCPIPLRLPNHERTYLTCCAFLI